MTATSLSQKDINKRRRKELIFTPMSLFIAFSLIGAFFFSDTKYNYLVLGIPMLFVFFAGFSQKKEMDLIVRLNFLFFGALGITPSIYELFIR